MAAQFPKTSYRFMIQADRDYGDAGGSDNVIGFRLARVRP